jgi:hypothetical protein
MLYQTQDNDLFFLVLFTNRDEILEYLFLDGISQLFFRMPLDGKHRRIGTLNGLDYPIARFTYNSEAGSQVLNRLMMEGIHIDFV